MHISLHLHIGSICTAPHQGTVVAQKQSLFSAKVVVHGAGWEEKGGRGVEGGRKGFQPQVITYSCG